MEQPVRACGLGLGAFMQPQVSIMEGDAGYTFPLPAGSPLWGQVRMQAVLVPLKFRDPLPTSYFRSLEVSRGQTQAHVTGLLYLSAP